KVMFKLKGKSICLGYTDDIELAELMSIAFREKYHGELKWSTKTGHRVRVFPVSIFRFVWG
ncbi:hypothetical protein N6N77_23155, partial [Escherichia albertii]|nr:hypothetical protein [Escherichia albertii]MCU7342845.1 hypothetical protein [Escherichia albertii]